MKPITRKLAALAAVVALGLTACTSGGGDDPDTGQGRGVEAVAQYHALERDTIVDGGTLTTHLTELSQFNPFHADAARQTLEVWRWYNPVLAHFTPEGEWSFNPDYLSDVREETINGNTTVTFTIRDEATFNDGTPIDWTAFEATWRANAGTDSAYAPSSTEGYAQIASVSHGESPKVAVVTFDGRWVWWQGLFNIVLHPKAASSEAYNTGYLHNPHPEWGAGPYAITSFDRSVGTIELGRNEKWWGSPGKLDARIFRTMDDAAAVTAFQNGELDAIGAASPEVRSQVKRVADTELRTSVLPSSSLFMLNAESDKLGDASVRAALMKGLDRSRLAAVRFDGLDYAEELPGSLILFPYQAGYRDNVAAAGITFNRSAAEALLDEAGWIKGDDGIRAKDGERLTLVYPLFSDLALPRRLATEMQAMYRDIGVDLQIDQRSSADFTDTMANKTFDALSMGLASSDPYGVVYFCQLWCSDSQVNKSGTGTPDLDERIAAMARLGTQQDQLATANEIEVDAFQRYGILPLWHGPEIIAAKKGLANYGADMFHVGPVQDIGWQK